MADTTDTAITDWLSYLEQSQAAADNIPTGSESIESSTPGEYTSLGNALRDTKRVVKEEFQHLGWNPANTFVNTADANTWELAATGVAVGSLTEPKYMIKIIGLNLIGGVGGTAYKDKDRLITRGSKVYIKTVISDVTYYWEGTVDKVTLSVGDPPYDTYLVCSNVRQKYVDVDANDTTTTDKIFLPVTEDYATTTLSNYDSTGTEVFLRGGFPNKVTADDDTWDANTVAATTSAILYVTSYRNRMIPHDPDGSLPSVRWPGSQAYLSNTDPTWSRFNDPDKMGMINELSPYPEQTQQGTFMARYRWNLLAAPQTFVAKAFSYIVPLPYREPNNNYCLYFTPLENYEDWIPDGVGGIEDRALTNAKAKERLQYTTDITADPKNCYRIVLVSKSVDHFIVEFSDRLPNQDESDDVTPVDVSYTPDQALPAILWEWKLVRDFRS